MTRGYYVVLQAIVLRSRFFAALVGACLLCLPALALNGPRNAQSLRSMAFERYLEKDLDSAFDYYQQAVEMALRCGFEPRYRWGAGEQYFWLWYFKK